MKPFAERNPLTLGTVGIIAVVIITTLALTFQKIPFVNGTTTYSGYFEDASGLHTGAPVDISGFPAGRVASIDLDGPRVLIKFTVDDNVHLGERTEAAIKTKGLLGSKMLEVIPKGDGNLTGTIPLERTVSAYQLPDALGDVTNAISGLDTHQLSDSLATVSEAFANTAPDLRDAVNGIARFSQTLNDRDAQLRSLLDNASKATAVLAKRSDQVVSLVKNTNDLLVQLRSQSAAVSRLWYSLSAVAQQLKGLIAENRSQLRPALDKLNGVVAILDNRKERLQQAVKGLSQYVLALGDAVSSGPFFKAYIVNLLPGQFVQPFVDAAFSDLGVDPNTKLPSQLADPQIGQPGTPPLPVPFPRTGQAGDPRLNLPDAISGKPGDTACGPPGIPLPGPGCYPARDPQPAPPPGGPPPGPPALAPGQTTMPEPPTTAPVHVSDPAQVPTPTPGGQP
ncbi:mammalian cell entry protein [Mycolicibacterium fortuitum]|uniref:MCE family protein n=1 Tax=Mycolicibacterium fortuitum TaxID=1766 RepID=UPI0007EE21F7|nr:MCE family protein [Mycolicibacterium fortuitum]OBI73187.1 mammalian cell entry protein [Mycolicibacterium fortuitum]